MRACLEACQYIRLRFIWYAYNTLSQLRGGDSIRLHHWELDASIAADESTEGGHGPDGVAFSAAASFVRGKSSAALAQDSGAAAEGAPAQLRVFLENVCARAAPPRAARTWLCISPVGRAYGNAFPSGRAYGNAFRRTPRRVELAS